MLAGAWSNLREKIARTFPERQIYHRTEGRVAYIAIGTKMQLAGCAVAAIAIGWLLYGTASIFLREYVISAHERSNAYQIAHYERLLQEARAREASAKDLLNSRTSEFQNLASTFERRHETLKSLLDQTSVAAMNDPEGGRVMMASISGDARPRESRAITEASIPVRQASAAGLNTRMTSLEAEQDRLMAIAETAAQSRIENVKEAMRLAGLSLADLTGGAEVQRGGPYIQIDSSGLFENEFDGQVTRVAARIAEAEEMEMALASAPIGHPVPDQPRKTSRFGARVDPFTKRAAYHTGMDIAAYYRAPVTATAPGVVSYSGWKGGFGRVIEIDHGRGFKTRYAHLSQIHVKKGDTVETGHEIGAMGSTGRSSGTHLHYEVWFKGKVYDPAKFLKAGEYVQQS